MNQFTRQDVIPDTVRTISQENIAERGIFYVGGEYVPQNGDFLMAGQMYVEVYVPKKIHHRYPLVLVHGNARTGVDFVQTLEGKAGWLQHPISVS